MLILVKEKGHLGNCCENSIFSYHVNGDSFLFCPLSPCSLCLALFLLVWVNLVNYPKAPVISVRSWYDVTVSLPLKLTPVFFETGCSRSCWLRRFYWQKCPLELERVASGSGPGYLDVINWFGGSVDCRKPRQESLPS